MSAARMNFEFNRVYVMVAHLFTLGETWMCLLFETRKLIFQYELPGLSKLGLREITRILDILKSGTPTFTNFTDFKTLFFTNKMSQIKSRC